MQTSPGLAGLFLADLPSLDKFDGNAAIFIAVGLIVFLLPHWLAARALAPEPTPGRVVSTATVQLGAVLISVALQAYATTMFGAHGAMLAGIALVLIFALVTAAIYNFGFLRGLGYNLIVAGILICVGWAADRYFASEGGLIAKLTGSKPAQADAAKATPATPAGPAMAAKASSPAAAGIPAAPPKAPASNTQRFATIQDAQAAAIARYPDLGRPESTFNKRFLEKHTAYKAKSDAILKGTDWPMQIASEVAAEMRGR